MTTTLTTPTPATVPFALESARLEEAGYTPGRPSWITASAYRIDRDCCAEATCDACGARGLRAEPFGNAAERSYVVLAVCPRCCHVEEF